MLPLLLGFLISCIIGYTYSVDYVFDNVLMPHQKSRINIVLGVDDDPGARAIISISQR
jgi:rod shape determining protein RodA